MQLRDYQKESIDSVLNEPEGGRYIISLAVGLGKSFVASQIPTQSRVLWLARTQELVEQPKKYFPNKSVGIEMNVQRNSGEDIVLASVQSIAKRLDKFSPYDFDLIIADECHECASREYRKVLEHFKPRYTVGLSATPFRTDGIRLDDIFSKITYQKDLIWGIENGYLCNLKCKVVKLDYDLTGVKKSNGDYSQSEIAERMKGSGEPIAEVYKKHSRKSTIIFAAGVNHAHEIAKAIGEEAGVIVGNTPKAERAELFERFNKGELKCLVNCSVFVQGVDCPRIDTVIMAKPTAAQGRFIQCLDAETEILTENGWKKNISKGEKVAAFDMTTEEVVFVPALETYRRKLYDDEFFIHSQTQTSDIRISNGHNVVVRNRKNKTDYELRTIENAANKDNLERPLCGISKKQDISYSDDMLKFIAWTITDGCLNKSNNAIQISQAEHQEDNISDIENVLKCLNLRYGKSVRWRDTNFKQTSRNVIYTICKGEPLKLEDRKKGLHGWSYLFKETDFCRNISKDIQSMSERQFELFFNEINKADGSKQRKRYFDTNGREYIQRTKRIGKGSKAFVENLQIMCIQNGYRANITAITNNYRNPFYIIQAKKERFRAMGHYDNPNMWISEKHTEEECWCVENEKHTLVTRRNGKVAILGNCVGRGLRLFEDKEDCLLVDCVGASNIPLCSAATLIGYDLTEEVKRELAEKDEFNMFELPKLADMISDVPATWIKSVKEVDLIKRKYKLNTRDLNLWKRNDGTLVLNSGQKARFEIPPIDAMGNVTFDDGTCVTAQYAIDYLLWLMKKDYSDTSHIWNKTKAQHSWGKQPMSNKQGLMIKGYGKAYEVPKEMTKFEASIVIDELIRRKNG